VDYGLDRAHVEVWNGHVFINLDPGCPSPLGPQLQAAAPDLVDFEPLRMKVAARRIYPIEANWKLVMENFWECYHCPTGHPEFCFAADVAQLNESDFGDLAPPGQEIPLVIEGPLPLKPMMRTLSVDGSPVCSHPLGQFPVLSPSHSRAATTGFLIRHCTAATYFEDHAILLDFQPVEVSRTDLVMRWLVRDDAVEGRDYEVERLIALWDVTNRQDRDLSERNQAGVRSSRYRPGPNSIDHEPGVYEFHRFCEERLAAGEIMEALY
jgi:glycine betaine catabolism A